MKLKKKLRLISLLVIVIAVLALILTISYSSALMKLADIQCSETCGGHDSTCPHANGVPIQTIAGSSLVIVLFLLGFMLFSFSKQIGKDTKIKKEKLNKIIKSLKNEEKKIYELLVDSDGAMLQSEIVDNSKLSKVKVTRTLDKLEGKSLIERRRRGMTNIVIIKHKGK
ncbi:MarR family transcriptional regulator [Candidatus Woesearchaeota archaeon]|nr:MarR family transcriptional regulator [Candidatus Woesearchaeota archaeon]